MNVVRSGHGHHMRRKWEVLDVYILIWVGSHLICRSLGWVRVRWGRIYFLRVRSRRVSLEATLLGCRCDSRFCGRGMLYGRLYSFCGRWRLHISCNSCSWAPGWSMCFAADNNNTDDDGENYKEYNPCNCSSCNNPTNIAYTERDMIITRLVLNCIIYPLQVHGLA